VHVDVIRLSSYEIDGPAYPSYLFS